MTGVHGQQAMPGRFRKIQNWIGRPGSTPATASFVPPPPDEVEPCLAAWEKFLHESELPPLVTIALAHYQFEAIHPFLDGNGRVGRLLITLFLIERQILPTPLLYLSAFFEAARREPNEAMAEDVRFKNYGLAPKSAADFAFLLHGFHFLKDEGVMAIILPHGVLFRGGAEERIRTKLLEDGNIDTVIGLPPNLFYSTGIPVCILVLKKCKKPDDVLFINAAEYFEKGKRQNRLRDDDIEKIVKTYQFRKQEERYSKRVSMERIRAEGYNLNISRYISTAVQEAEINLKATHTELVKIEQAIQKATKKHNEFLKELNLSPLP